MFISLRNVIRHRTFLAMVAFTILWGGFALLQQLVAPGRLDPALREAMSHEQIIGRIAVNFEYVPEEFHINSLQQYGIVAGVQGKTIFLVQVPVEELRRLSQVYWVQSIRLADQ